MCVFLLPEAAAQPQIQLLGLCVVCTVVVKLLLPGPGFGKLLLVQRGAWEAVSDIHQEVAAVLFQDLVDNAALLHL